MIKLTGVKIKKALHHQENMRPAFSNKSHICDVMAPRYTVRPEHKGCKELYLTAFHL